MDVTRGIYKTALNARRNIEAQKATRADQPTPARLLDVLVEEDPYTTLRTSRPSSREHQHGGGECSQPCKAVKTISSQQHSAGGKELQKSNPALKGPTLPWAPQQPSAPRARTHSSKQTPHTQQGRKQQVISLLGKRPVSSVQGRAATCAAAPFFNHYDDGRGSWVCPVSMLSRCCTKDQHVSELSSILKCGEASVDGDAACRSQRRLAWRLVLTELNGNVWASVTAAKTCTTRGFGPLKDCAANRSGCRPEDERSPSIWYGLLAAGLWQNAQ